STGTGATRASSAAGSGVSVGSGAGGDESPGRRIERDIFAARPSRGQALGVSTGYDVFPETGDYETYDSDEDTGKTSAKVGGADKSALSKRSRGTTDLDDHPAFEAPKASFPFGVKNVELSSRKGGKPKTVKNKIDTELNMINKYMKGEK
ncbi:unnamed protein product, partial [Choristocarpus tenellus]